MSKIKILLSGSTNAPHRLQTVLAECHAVQCGMDSPGIVVSMMGLLVNNPHPTMTEIERNLVGNISRCNGYRAVLEAYKEFATAPNKEREAFEAKLPQLPEAPKDPITFLGKDITWHLVPSMFWLKTLQAKHADAGLIYGVPFLHELQGFKIVLDVSRAEHLQKKVKSHHEFSANLTITEFVEQLHEILSVSNYCVIQECINVLNNTKTMQYRNTRALGDAIKDCLELQVLFMCLHTKLSINASPHCKIMKFVGTEKTITVEEALDHLEKFSVKSIHVPVFTKDQQLMFVKVSDRKANGTNSKCASFLVTVENSHFTGIQACTGSQATKVEMLDNVEEHLKGVNCCNLDLMKAKVQAMALVKPFNGLINSFVHEVKKNAQKSQKELIEYYKSRGLSRIPMKSTQYDECVCGDLDKDTVKPLGRPIPSIQALMCATGEAIFTDDIPGDFNELSMAFVQSTIAHGKLKSLDASEALAMKGVKRFFCAKDVPEEKNKWADEKMFVDDLIEYEGDIIGVIVAIDEKTARKAAALVKVEYEELEAVATLEDAIKKGKVLNIPEGTVATSFKKGDVEVAFAQSERVITGHIKTPRQEHFYEECGVVKVVPTGENDELDIYGLCCILHQQAISQFLSLPLNKIHTYYKRGGCNFGGKGPRYIPFFNIACFIAHKMKKSIRCRLNRDEDIRISGQRGEFIGHYSIGVKEGKIMGAKYELSKNAGWSADFSADVLSCALIHLDNSYNFPAMEASGKVYVTNTPSNTAFRAFGAPPALTITENMLFDVCAEMNYDPVEFRRNNFQEEGYVTHFGQVLEPSDVTMKQCYEEMIKISRYEELRKEVDSFNAENTTKKRGIALLPNKYGIGIPPMIGHQGCLINIYTDGSVYVNIGGGEFGQGLFTKVAQIVSHELGIPMSRIRMGETTNKIVPNAMLTGGSTGADLSGNAARDACQKINEKLAPFKEAQPKAPWEMLIGMAFASRVNLSTTGYFRIDTAKFTYDSATGQGRRWWYYSTGATMSLVELDLLTGEHTLLKASIIMELGEAINPAIDIANIEAAFIQGWKFFSCSHCQKFGQARS